MKTGTNLLSILPGSIIFRQKDGGISVVAKKRPQSERFFDNPYNSNRKNSCDMDPIIKIESLSLAFGGVQALYSVDTHLAQGAIHAIIGPNGAGKTCLFNCISRFYTPQEGQIFYKGKDITRLPTHSIARLGIARTFQNIELFKGMTVLDNIKLGRHAFLKSGIFSDMLYWGRTQREELALRKEIEETIIDLLEIESIRKKVVGTLPYGLQKRVELARCAGNETAGASAR